MIRVKNLGTVVYEEALFYQRRVREKGGPGQKRLRNPDWLRVRIPAEIRGEEERAPGILVKSGMMLGLGETKDEVLKSLRDLREHGRLARGIGFTHVASAPLVRFSYLAEEALLGRKGN